jgi:hypothetical protein
VYRKHSGKNGTKVRGHEIGPSTVDEASLPSISDGSEQVLPPFTNRGVENNNHAVNVGIHWLVITVHKIDVRDILRLISDRLLENDRMDIWKTEGGKNFYKESYRAVMGIVVMANPADTNDDYLSIRFPGEACEYIGTGKLLSLIKYLRQNHKVNVTRADIAWDYCPFQPEDLFIEMDRGAMRSYVKSWVKIQGNDGGYTLYLGSRKSDRFLRSYLKLDKGYEGATRTELVIKNKFANYFIDEVMTGGDFPRIASSHLLGFVDFPELAGWKDVIGGAVRPELGVGAYEENDVRNKAKYFEDNCFTLLAAYLRKNEMPDLLMLAEYGESKLREKFGSRK